MIKKVILTVGAPGSGKSTWAKEEAKSSKEKTIVLARDDMRMMLVGGGIYKYSREREKQVTAFVKECLINALNDSTTQKIIIADTNLNESTRKMFEGIVDLHNLNSDKKAEIEYKVFDVNWIELVKRNNQRGEKSVPIDVLRSMYKNMQIHLGVHKEYVPDENLPKAIIFDIDGTLADNSHRNAFEFGKCIYDKPIDWVVKTLKTFHQNGYKIICLSGRNSGDENDPVVYRELTKNWLIENDIPFDRLMMRKAKDFRKDDVVKEEIFWNNIADDYNVLFCVDDRQQVVDMWRRIGVNCFQCNYGDF